MKILNHLKFNSRIVKIVLTAMILLISSEFPSVSYAAETIDNSKISGQSAVLIEEESGDVLFEKNMNKKIYPASTTKIMTALLVLENLSPDEIITVPEDFPHVEGSSLYLMIGEKFTVKQLVEALLVHSCNDVAVLFANRIGGDVNTFVQMMNDRAKKIGCKNTHFENPHGLHDPNHYSTAYDMALIAKEAMKNDEFRRIVSMDFMVLEANDIFKEKRYLQSTNRFLWSKSKIIYKNKYIPIKWDAVNGIKTGQTPEAGNCLITSARENNMNLISAVYKANGFEVYRDSRLILDYGFDNFKIEKVLTKNKVLGKIKVPMTVQETVSYVSGENYSICYPMGEKPKYKVVFEKQDFKLPLKKGDKVGTVTVTDSKGDKRIFDAYANNQLESIFTLKHIKEIFLSKSANIFSLKTLFTIVAVAFLIILTRIIGINIKKRNRKNRYKRL